MSDSDYDDIEGMDNIDGIDDSEFDESMDYESDIDAFSDNDDDLSADDLTDLSDSDADDKQEDSLTDGDTVNQSEKETADGKPPLNLIVAAVVGTLIIGYGGYSTFSTPSTPAAVVQQQYTPPPAQVAPQPVVNQASQVEMVLPEPVTTPANKRISDEQMDMLTGLSSTEMTLSAEPDEVTYTNSNRITKEEFRAIIAEELQKQTYSNRQWMTQLINQQTDDVLNGIELPGIEEKLQSLGVTIQETNKTLKAQKDQFEAFASKNLKVVDHKKLKELLKDRKRLPGFQVINSSEDHEISIVRSPSGRISAFFESERFYVDGKTHFVTGIYNSGSVILVDKEYFIDGTYVRPAPKKAKQTTQEVKKAPKKKVVSKSSSPAKVKAKKVKAVDLSKQGQPVAEKKDVTTFKVDPPSLTSGDMPTDGWSFHGIFDGGYLLNNPNGDWIIVRNGQLVEGLGQVAGVDQYRQILIGKYLIPLAM